MDQLAWRVEAAAARIGISRAKLYELINAGRLRATKVDGRTVITEAALVAFLKECTAAGGDAA